jgi:hypothetical protein
MVCYLNTAASTATDRTSLRLQAPTVENSAWNTSITLLRNRALRFECTCTANSLLTTGTNLAFEARATGTAFKKLQESQTHWF